MTAIVWIVEDTWRATVDAARAQVPAEVDLALLHVTGDDVAAAAHGAFAGLLGRGRRAPDPGERVADLSRSASDELLEAAARRLERPAARLRRHGRVERVVVEAADGADLLVCARDGDLRTLGPHSLGPATRFVVDHAPCPLLLVWPEATPGIDSLPPPPPRPPPPPPAR
ncbi:universal stress protein [Streptomyces sp. TP-A0874]|uniref:universal stress protein n=1 Tax=Streptomyces sp. TP-A0874 TaxID=549819 RepID=UPI0008536C40|nr:universal stress protein [Streptomyces sp. TP-A0874]